MQGSATRLIDLLENIHKHTLKLIHDIIHTRNHIKIRVYSGKLSNMPWSKCFFTSKHRTNLKDSVIPCGEKHSFVHLGAFRKQRWLTEKVKFKCINIVFQARGYNFR